MAPISANDGKIVGIIYPPPEVRNIVDKTASFVARNGPEFEQRIKQNEINNPKFTFLNSGDPYHAYYQHRVIEIREGKETPAPPKVMMNLTTLRDQINVQDQISVQDDNLEERLAIGRHYFNF